MMALREGLPGTIYRKDYEAPDFGLTRSTCWCRSNRAVLGLLPHLTLSDEQPGTAPQARRRGIGFTVGGA
ncbi:MAG: hypothetical protein CM15mP74_07450 [Halieaceae bacterium]|nr:MAG: hypothetical protein CM15mP74_07450 [Halieaceae bacterium]